MTDVLERYMADKALNQFLDVAKIRTAVNAEGLTEMYVGLKVVATYELGDYFVRCVRGPNDRTTWWGTTDLDGVVDRDRKTLLLHMVMGACGR